MAKTRKTKKNLTQYGSIVFGVGLAIAIIAGFFTNLGATATQVIIATLAIIGVVVGILNVTRDEAVSFLVASLVLVLLIGPFLGLISQNFFQSQILGNIFGNIVALVVPAATIVALITLFNVARDE